MSDFQATIDCRFAPLATLKYEDADLDSVVTHFNQSVTDTATELYGKQCRRKEEIQNLSDQSVNLMKSRGEIPRVKTFREIK